MNNISALLDYKLKVSLSEFSNSFKSILKEEVKCLVRSEIGYLINELKEEFTVTTDYITNEQLTIKADINNKNKTIKLLEADNLKLRNQINNIEKRLNNFENNSRNMNLELQLIPEHRNENTIDLFKKLCSIVQVPVTDVDIRACRRVAQFNKTSSRPRNILVSLNSSTLRDSILSATLRYNKGHRDAVLSATHLGLTGGKIYVCEHISPDMKILHSTTRKVCKEKGIKYIWIKYGRLYVRRDENGPAINIKCKESLDTL